MSKKYKVNLDDSMVDGKKFTVDGEEYTVNLPRRGFLKASAVFAAGGIGIGSYANQSQPVLAAEGDWSASDVQGVDGINGVLVGDGDIELTWGEMPTEDLEIHWVLEARLEEEGIESGSDEFEAVAEGDTSNSYEIEESDTPSGSDTYITFFSTTTSFEDSNFTLDTEEYDEYDDLGATNILDEHSNIMADDFNLDEGEDERRTVVELRLSLDVVTQSTGARVASTEVQDAFEVVIDDGGDTTVDGSAGTNIA